MKYLVIIFIFLCNITFANPEGANVTSGNANFSNTNTQTLNIETSDKTVINWNSFSISQLESTNFIMPNEMSSVLNRVTGMDPSAILGSLNANGQVILINPNGIWVGQDACINTASFIGSTFDVIDSDFLNSNDLLFTGNSKEALTNLGKISATSGDVILISYNIKNSGSLEAENGVVGLAAGKEVLIKPSDKQRIYIKTSLSDDKDDVGIENFGAIKALQTEIKADGNLYTLAIKDASKIDAFGIKNENGRVYLVADDGRCETSSTITAKNSDNTGGTVHLLGKEVGILDEAYIDVTGEYQGGTVLVGGDYQGNNPDISNAKAIFISQDATINASCLESGDGGRVILWGNEANNFYGTVLATGGAIYGNGGFIEVSSPTGLNFQGDVNASAFNGTSGLLLLDPVNISIGNFGGTSTPGFTNPYSPSVNATLDVGNLVVALNAQNVTVQSTQGTVGLGNIDVAIAISWNANTSLTLDAGNVGAITTSANIINNYATGKYKLTLIGNTIIVSSDITLMSPNATLVMTGKQGVGGGSILIADGAGSAILNASNMTITTDAGLSIGAVGFNAGIDNTIGSGTITIQSNYGSLNIQSGDNDAFIKAGASNLTIDLVGNLKLNQRTIVPLPVSTSVASIESTTGKITIAAVDVDIFGGTISGPNSNSFISSNSGDISVTAGYTNFGGDINITANAFGNAFISSTTGNISLSSVEGSIALLSNNGYSAYISNVTSGNITVATNTSGNISITAGSGVTGGNAYIGNTSGTTTINSVGNVLLSAGSGGTSNASIVNLSGDLNGSITSNLTLTSTAFGNAYINTTAGNIDFTKVSGTTLTGSGANAAYITATGPNTNVSINSSGSSGPLVLNNLSYIRATKDVLANISGASSLNPAATLNEFAEIASTTSGSVTINNSNGGLSLNAGSASGADARITAISYINIYTTSGDIVFQSSDIGKAFMSCSGNIFINTLTSGNISLTGGSGATGADAYISNTSGVINLASAGNLSLTAGSTTPSNAYISNGSGNITGDITGNMTLTSTANGSAYITTPAGNIDFANVGNTTLTGSGANAAYITATGPNTDVSINSSGNGGSLQLNENTYINATRDVKINCSQLARLTAGLNNPTEIASTIKGNITINCDGELDLWAGASPNSEARITTVNGDISISKTSTGPLYLLALSTAPSSDAYIKADIGNITVSTDPGTIFMKSENGGKTYISNSTSGDISVSSTTGDIFINGSNVGLGADAYISNTSGTTTINCGGNLTLLAGSAATSNAYITSTSGDINGSLNNIIIDTSATGEAYITTTNGAINFSRANNVSLNGSAPNDAYITTSGNNPIQINTILTPRGSLNLYDHSYIDTIDGGDITIFVAGDSQLQGQTNIFAGGAGGAGSIILSNSIGDFSFLANATGAPIVKTRDGDINIISENKISLTNAPGGQVAILGRKLTSDFGKVTLIAGDDINITGSIVTGQNILSVRSLGSFSLTANSDPATIISENDIDVFSQQALTLSGSSTQIATIKSITSPGNIVITTDQNFLMQDASAIETFEGGDVVINSFADSSLTGNANINTAINSGSGDIDINNFSGHFSLLSNTTAAPSLNTNNGNISILTDLNFHMTNNLGGNPSINSLSNGTVFIDSNQSLILVGGDITSADRVLAIAYKDIRIDANSSITSVNFLDLVADDQYPESPLFGTGKIVIENGATFTMPSNIVRFYTNIQNSDNIPSGMTINGTLYTQGLESSGNEEWDVYYPEIFTPEGPGFKIYYKSQFSDPILGNNFFGFNVVGLEIFNMLKDGFNVDGIYAYDAPGSNYNYIILNPFAAPNKKYIFENEKYDMQIIFPDIKETEKPLGFWDKAKEYINEKWSSFKNLFKRS